jgi:hypothetical protein
LRPPGIPRFCPADTVKQSRAICSGGDGEFQTITRSDSPLFSSD